MRSGLISTALLVPVFRLIRLLLVLINVPILLHDPLSLPFHTVSTLTFACFHSMDKNDMYMFAGRDEVDYYNVHQYKYDVSHVVIHEHFNRTTNENDISLLKTRHRNLLQHQRRCLVFSGRRLPVTSRQKLPVCWVRRHTRLASAFCFYYYHDYDDDNDDDDFIFRVLT